MNDSAACTRCATEKPRAMFAADKRKSSGLSSFCKACHVSASRAWQAANPEKVNATRRARYQRQRAEINKSRRAVYEPGDMRWDRLRYLYKVSQDWYESTLLRQSGCCAICKKPAGMFSRALAVDHNHDCCPKAPTCGECSRGLLCHHCNTALHALEHDRAWVDGALNYLGEKR